MDLTDDEAAATLEALDEYAAALRYGAQLQPAGPERTSRNAKALAAESARAKVEHEHLTRIR